MHYTAMAGLTISPHAAPMSGAPALSTDLLAIVVAIVAFLMSAVFLLLLVPDRTPAMVAEAQPVSPPAGVQDVSAPPPAPALAPSHAGADPDTPRTRRLPVERDGATHFIPMEDVVAVHANAHYTYIFDGSAKFFCPLAISDVEARLDRTRFIRVHRSHIVNIDRVVGLKRAGDNGVIELADRYTVPVSRSQFGRLRSRLGVGPHEAVG
jgi:DNA-binding LytR/AlgR family response regulator